jgi:hypothetical protein
MLQVWFLSWQTEVNPRKPLPATPLGVVKQNIPDSSARRREVGFANGEHAVSKVRG